MAGKIEIINLALGRANCRLINALDSSGKEERLAALCWDTTRDAALRAHPWGFASRRAKLALLADTPQAWEFAYLEPPDCLAVRKILPSPEFGADQPSARFEVGNIGNRTAILSDLSQAFCEYTARVDNPNLFDPGFVDALAWRLAAEFATGIKSDYEAASGMMQLANAAANRAEAESAGESVFEDDPISSFERARWS